MVADWLRHFQRRLGTLGAVFVFAVIGLPAVADDGTTIRVGVRSDAAPFSKRVMPPQSLYKGRCDEQTPSVTYRGYSVDLCRDFIGHLQTQHPGKLDYCFVEVVTYRGENVLNRFDALANGDIDMLCGATTATLEVQSRFRTSLVTFLSTSTFIYNDKSVSERVADQVPLRIGVLSNSTSDERKNPDAEIQQVLVRKALGSVGVMPPVTFKSHLDVPEMLCTPNRDRTGCHGGRADDGDENGAKPESDAAVGAQTSNDCGWQTSRSIKGWWRYLQCLDPRAWGTRQWVQLTARLPMMAGDNEGEPSGGPETTGGARKNQSPSPGERDVSEARGRSEGEASEKGDPASSQFQERRASKEIDVYISDRPILEAILERPKNERHAADIVLSSEVLISQPYAIVFPSVNVDPSSPTTFGDLQLEFNRFLVEQLYAPQQRTELDERLKLYFRTTVDRSFINMLPVLSRWPIGAAPILTDAAAAGTEPEATGGD